MRNKTYYYHDMLNDDFAATKITSITIDENYKYINKNIFYRIGETIIRCIAFPIILIILKLSYILKIKNRKVLKQARKTGYFLYGNHTNYLLDAYAPSIIARYRRAHIIVNPDAVSIKGLSTIVKMLGAIPIPTTRKGMKNYFYSIESLYQKKHVITIYPEAHIWPFYTDIRPFGNESFHYPYNLNAPCYSFTNIYKKRLVGKKPKVVTYVDGPFYPDMNLSKKEAISKLRNDIYNAMKDRVNSFKKYEYCKYIYVENPTLSNTKNTNL